MVERPANLVFRTSEGVSLSRIVVLIGAVWVALLIFVFVLESGHIVESLPGVMMVGMAWTMALGGYVAIRNSARSREKRKIDRLFSGPVWACWGFQQGELAPAGASSVLPFRIWFGRNGVYHELIGYTPLDRLVSVEYCENFTPKRTPPKGMFASRDYLQGWIYEFSAMPAKTPLDQLRPLERLGDSSTPKIEFGVRDTGSEGRDPIVAVYFPVPHGCEPEAKALVQRYQKERRVHGRDLSK